MSELFLKLTGNPPKPAAARGARELAVNSDHVLKFPEAGPKRAQRRPFAKPTAQPSPNPAQPTPGNRRKFFDFDESRLYAASTYLFNGTPQSFAARGSSTAAGFSPYPVYFTGHPSCGLPYVYFDSRCYDDGPASDINYAAINASGDTSIASSYINSLPTANGTWAQQHMAGDTFQLIAAGKDGMYGASSVNKAAYPAVTAYSVTWQGSNYTYASVKDPINGTGHADNLTNFADRPLVDAIDAQSQ